MWIELYGYASSLCAFLIGVMLGVSRRSSISLKIGSFLFIAISIWLGQLHLFISGALIRFPELIFMQIPFAISTGPLFYLFIQSVFKEEFLWRRTQWAHIVFVMILSLFFLPIALIPKEDKIELVRKNFSVISQNLKYYILFFLNISYLVPGVYIAFSFRFLLNTRILFSAGKEKALFAFYLVLGIFAVSMSFTFSGFRMEFSFLKAIGAVGFSTGIFLIFILLSRYPDFLDLVSRDIREIQRKQNRIHSDLSESALEKIKYLFEVRKIYLNDDLSLKSLGNQLSLRPDQLSQVVNDSYGMNFNRFLNYHRIQEAIRILKEDPEAKIIHVAMRCGFNSKSSFNESFRRETGTTPTEYFKKKSMES
ncbi:AraC family transcriptional regulator [Leptospira sp. 201903071]|uniref:AraC family transcriptional regulator n=1 Tax=Leptospira ainazelensis TaxID=2810034 RepID=UPI0019667825|nr:helix-turn-helix domain-containing protein [Leptospira ainazelensis]MBM9498751.1 AraC family transcriptional regulator [Leptospira ainazelensis]